MIKMLDRFLCRIGAWTLDFHEHLKAHYDLEVLDLIGAYVLIFGALFFWTMLGLLLKG